MRPNKVVKSSGASHRFSAPLESATGAWSIGLFTLRIRMRGICRGTALAAVTCGLGVLFSTLSSVRLAVASDQTRQTGLSALSPSTNYNIQRAGTVAGRLEGRLTLRGGRDTGSSPPRGSRSKGLLDHDGHSSLDSGEKRMPG
jgi:hypothetical protein